MDIFTLILIFIIGLLTSIMGVMVGSSGLIRIPLLILLGLPPQIAIASNKVGTIGRSITGLYKYGKEKLVNTKIGFSILALQVAGAATGSYILVSISGLAINKILAIVIFVVIFLLIFKREIGLKKIKQIPKKNWIIGLVLFFIAGIWGGFIGAGAGTVQTYILVSVFGLTFLESAATRRMSNLVSSLVSVSILAYYSVINWQVGLVLFVGCGIGGWIGASIAIKKGNKFIKILFIVVALALGIKLLIG